ncbi:MAG: hypothetical protein F6J98_02955 [Moorea sp. SIO4G2]|nr:hypothetical protein [Moorena sp. SIO4G2]
MNDKINQEQSLDFRSKNFLREVDVLSSGECKTSIRGSASMAGVDPTGLSRALKPTQKGVDLKWSSLAEYLFSKGLEPVDLERFSSKGIPDWVNHYIITYYAIKAGRYCTKQAGLSLEAFGQYGIRCFLQKIKGWKESTPQLSKAELAFSNWETRKDLYLELQDSLNTIRKKVISRFSNPTDKHIQEVMQIAWDTASFAIQGKTENQVQQAWEIEDGSTALFMDEEILGRYTRVFKIVAEWFLVKSNHLGSLIEMASGMALMGERPEMHSPAPYLWGDDDELYHELISIEHTGRNDRWTFDIFDSKYQQVFAPAAERSRLTGN